MADGPAFGLELSAALEATRSLADHHLPPAARADLRRRVVPYAKAAAAYRKPLELVSTDSARSHLARRLSAIPHQQVAAETGGDRS